MIIALPQAAFAVDGGMVYAECPDMHLKSTKGDIVAVRESDNSKIIIFYNIGCSHCEKVAGELKEAAIDTDNVDIIMAESRESTLEEVMTYEHDNGIKGVAYCYDAKTACWDCLYTSGYSSTTTVKPVIMYVSSDNKIMGYTYSYENIFKYAEKYGIILKETDEHNHQWKKVSRSPGYCRKGFQYKQCLVCGQIKSIKTSKGLGPGKTYISRLVQGKNTLTVKWKGLSAAKQSRIYGYQIRYSRNSGMKNAAVITVTDSSARIVKVPDLKSGKKYYVQIRTYAQTGTPDNSIYDYRINQQYFSGWSGVKTAVTK